MTEPIMPYTIVVPTSYGTMLLNRYDINQTNSLVKSGVGADHLEIMLIVRLLDVLPAGERKVFVDIGANTGTHTIGIAKHLGVNGVVYAFEPQRMMFQLICGSAAINSMTNVHCYNVAVGSSAGEIDVPHFDYFSPMNFGSIEFGLEQLEPLHQVRGTGRGQPEKVSRVTLDSFEFSDLHVLKIDVEGMEFEVLEGAVQTLARCSPVILIEYLKVGREELGHRLKAANYHLYDMAPNFLCIPGCLASTIDVGMPEI